jgi:hypothetical protein
MAGDDKTPPTSPKEDGSGKEKDAGARGSGKGEVVRIVREYAGPANWPMLTKINYTSWSTLMKLKMEARGLWKAVESDDVSFQDDRSALEAITSGVPPEMAPSLVAKGAAKAAW